MLLGEYEHTIDDKNRLTLPAKFRRAFEDGGVVTRGLDGCLHAWPQAAWEQLVDSRLASLDVLSVQGRRLHRHCPGCWGIGEVLEPASTRRASISSSAM